MPTLTTQVNSEVATEQELDCYEEIDDYLSFVNRTMRNLSLASTQSAS
ncbi:hypothetical protein H6G76_30305 [Nostoc sp. FACHB-152]|nr:MULTISPECIES: hypothetical protein [unclassified Nostoc]MBD2451344.1 hypothetical protein [Nostoc sp. FACHB-152]MBD2466305.1 hypothetical protein [Nostoc sp. FACHB-145]